VPACNVRLRKQRRKAVAKSPYAENVFILCERDILFIGMTPPILCREGAPAEAITKSRYKIVRSNQKRKTLPEQRCRLGQSENGRVMVSGSAGLSSLGGGLIAVRAEKGHEISSVGWVDAFRRRSRNFAVIRPA